MSRLHSLLDNRVIQNIVFWVILFFILMATIQADDRVMVSIYSILLLSPAAYINNLFILPYLRNNLPVFLSLFLLNTAIFTVISVWIISKFSGNEIELYMFVNFFGILVLALAFATAIKLAKDSFTRRQQDKEAELKLLKAQLNPHFLFNTLNNLYGLSVVKSEKLPGLMLKLSDLLRYSLYETKDTEVSLQKEITYLENYIALEKIRLEDQTDIEFEKSGDLNSKSIAPMLLIVFVENAFKHLGDLKNGKSYVKVKLKIDKDKLIFECENTFDKNYTNPPEKPNGGIGLKNVRKRLELLYSKNYQLIESHNNTSYNVILKLII